MSWSGRMGPLGSHQSLAMSSNFSNSACCVLGMASISCVGLSKFHQPVFPPVTRLTQAVYVQCRQLPAGHQGSSGHPGVGDLMTTGTIDQCGDRVEDGPGFQLVQIDGAKIGGLADLDRAGSFFDAESSGARQ